MRGRIRGWACGSVSHRSRPADLAAVRLPVRSKPVQYARAHNRVGKTLDPGGTAGGPLPLASREPVAGHHGRARMRMWDAPGGLDNEEKQTQRMDVRTGPLAPTSLVRGTAEAPAQGMQGDEP